MKVFIAVLFAFCTLSVTVHAQILQKLSLGIQGGRTTPTGIKVEGEQPHNFKPERIHNFSKGVFLQYELADDFYVRGSFKKAALDLENSYKPSAFDVYSYGIGPDNKQLELSLGYRHKIYKRLNLTSSLGATYLDFERWSLPVQQANNAGPYQVKLGVDQVREKSVLLNGAIGLEYKTKREHAFLMELAYYKGFSDVLRFNSQIEGYTDVAPYHLQYDASIKTKGDYRELRIGYRMPLQKFVNLYSAIKNPQPKPDLDPEYIKLSRNIGKYWGLEIARQAFYSNQVQKFPDYSIKRKNSHWTPSFTYFQGYQFKSRLMLEGGLRLGASTVVVDAREPLGEGGQWSALMLTAPISVKYALPFLQDKIYLVPEIGFWLSYSPGISETDSYWPTGRSVLHIKGIGQDYNVGYLAGLSLNRKIGKNSELGVGYRYSDKFSKKAATMAEITYYDNNGILQPAIIAASRLQNVAVSISYRKFFQKEVKHAVRAAIPPKGA